MPVARRLLFAAALILSATASIQALAQATPDVCGSAGSAPGQTEACATLAAPGLTVEDPAVTTRPDVYGRDVPYLSGLLVNNGDTAYDNIALSAAVFDDQDEQIGDGIGYLVNACGAGLLPDFTLQPGSDQPFEIPLELTDPEAIIARSEVMPDATAAALSAVSTEVAAMAGITQVSAQEVVDVEWIDHESLRFGAGCDRSLFFDLNWSIYNLSSKALEPTTHPHSNDVTDTLRQRLKLTDDALLAQSMLTFSPQGKRLVYLGDRKVFNTAQQDGTYARTLYNDLYNRTLQGILWLSDSRFLAYFFGAYGDPVYYFTATEQGQPISLPLAQGQPSDIVPGASPDGRQAVIAGTLFETAGYYLKSLVSNNDPELLFAGESAGNNYPAPLFRVDPGDDPHNRVYIARPIDDRAQIQCYNLTEKKLYDLGPLPLQISTDERAWWWLSPDNQWIALAANGTHGGLWMIALANLPTCGI